MGFLQSGFCFAFKLLGFDAAGQKQMFSIMCKPDDCVENEKILSHTTPDALTKAQR
ncbi:hypothetical protein [Deinococcus cellulosilyticus]|uniref:Uncharacterized protein n=1 Tax=Deinococcus cellulosilyticus (strain DSM 18568 / NBRC 106333 / KACC 11606 / 5516J-15) TaxID=1223518 RepID=A0A511MWZ8_DEIC1|nr:hypothetical protein [Deinococcus cellulosilyticus]GEM45103.1 hypothetical protein DC3_07380 [Deinococcus cellulosilyticus NBRC 106333 = KACC 11606]